MSRNTWRSAVAICTAALLASTTLDVIPASAQNGGYAPPPGSDQDAAPPGGSYAEPPPGTDDNAAYDDQTQQQDEAYAGRLFTLGGAELRQSGQQHRRRGRDRRHPWRGHWCGREPQCGQRCPRRRRDRRRDRSGCRIGFGRRWLPARLRHRGRRSGLCVRWPVCRLGTRLVPSWVWVGGRWVYHPYRRWYWAHRNYWRPGWHGRPTRWHRRW